MEFGILLLFYAFFGSFAWFFPYNLIVAGSLAIAAGSKWKWRGVGVVLAGTLIFHALWALNEVSHVGR
jgi:hypothetical protein